MDVGNPSVDDEPTTMGIDSSDDNISEREVQNGRR